MGPEPAAGGHWRRSRPPRGVLGAVQAPGPGCPAASWGPSRRRLAATPYAASGGLAPARGADLASLLGRGGAGGRRGAAPRWGTCLSPATCEVTSSSHESVTFCSQTKCFLHLRFLPKIRIPCSAFKARVAAAGRGARGRRAGSQQPGAPGVKALPATRPARGMRVPSRGAHRPRPPQTGVLGLGAEQGLLRRPPGVTF